MFILFLLTLVLAPAPPDVKIVPSPGGFVAKVGDFEARQTDAVDAEINRRARAICKDNQIRWGKFSSVAALGKAPGSEPVMVRGYTREFSCIVAEQASYEPAPADWKATAGDLDDVLGVFGRYYDKRDAGDFAAARTLMKRDLIGDFADWSAQQERQNKKLGRGKRRVTGVTGVTWYVNPDGAPHPGVYVAIDFVGDFPEAYFYCGYVVLFRKAGGSYEITREEQNMFTHGDGTADPAQISQMRSGMCRGQ